MRRRFAFRLLSILALFASANVASAQIRMVQVDELTREVTVRNFGGSTVDISGYFMCRAPGTYEQTNTLTIVSGDLNLSPDEQVTFVYLPIIFAGTGIGLYANGTGFGNAANMVDYMQYKGVAGFREGVAVSAGIWTAGTFATGASGPYFYVGDGSDNGAAFWTNVAPAVPALPFPALAGLALLFVAAGALVLRRRAVPVRA